MDLSEDESELGRAMRRHPGRSADALIEDLAEQLGRECESEAPVDMRLLASMQGIGDISETFSQHSGCLINDGGRLRIELRITDPEQRQRFTIGHEVCHTLLPGFTLERNFRSYSCTPGGSTPKRGTTLDIEWLADVGASELLLPRRFVRDRFDTMAFGWDAIEKVARDYNASLEATARRFVRLAPTPAIFARLTFAASKADPNPKLRVRSSSHSPDLNVFIPANKSVPNDHPVFNASLGEDVDTVVDMQSLCAPGEYRVVARRYPLPTAEGESLVSVMLIGLKTTTATVLTR